MTQFWSDFAITGFALVLIFDGLVLLFARNKAIFTLAFALTILATAGNLFYLLLTFSQGLATISALAVIFGVYIAISQWNLLNAMRRTA